MKLIIQPHDGVTPITTAIKNAKKNVRIAIFRFEYGAIEAALKAAVARGVKVTALIANTNRGGVRNLRALEMRFLAAGIVVARTDDDLLRYHDKYIIIDERVLYMLSFNFTRLDIDRSRGFGIVTQNPRLVQEALKLFDADSTRSGYVAKMDRFVVSPVNSRKVLGNFIKRAKKQLLIFDPKISDKEMLTILRGRIKAGVEVRVIGRVAAKIELSARESSSIRLHTRTIIRDNRHAFIGSQSLRAAELDLRRELGLIVGESEIIKKLVGTFESDWTANLETKGTRQTFVENEEPNETLVASEIRVTKVLAEELHPMSLTLKKAVKKAVAEAGEEAVEEKMVKNTVKKMVKKAVKEAVREVALESKEIERSA